MVLHCGCTPDQILASTKKYMHTLCVFIDGIFMRPYFSVLNGDMLV